MPVNANLPASYIFLRLNGSPVKLLLMSFSWSIDDIIKGVTNFNVVHIGPESAGAPKYGLLLLIPKALYFCFKLMH